MKQDELFDWDGWEVSWQLSEADFEPKDNTDDETLTADAYDATTRINEVFLLDWGDSCLIITPSLEPEEENSKIWSLSFGFRQQIRWVSAKYLVVSVTFMMISYQSNISELAPRHLHLISL